MVDSRQKGARAETALVNLLKKDTGLNWKRVPGSGALHADHGLKGDAYVPNEHNFWAAEIKHYKDCHLDYKILTSKEPQLLEWWKQTIRQGKQTNKKPILFFKHDRSKWFVMMLLTDIEPKALQCRHLKLEPEGAAIFVYDTWVVNVLQYIRWTK